MNKHFNECLAIATWGEVRVGLTGFFSRRGINLDAAIEPLRE